ncbi:hypothetical protein KC347_g28 [Hortaea werneckii]|nr:hypothetical protein KC347_g28 [Hortaea werneckii]
MLKRRQWGEKATERRQPRERDRDLMLPQIPIAARSTSMPLSRRRREQVWFPEYGDNLVCGQSDGAGWLKHLERTPPRHFHRLGLPSIGRLRNNVFYLYVYFSDQPLEHHRRRETKQKKREKTPLSPSVNSTMGCQAADPFDDGDTPLPTKQGFLEALKPIKHLLGTMRPLLRNRMSEEMNDDAVLTASETVAPTIDRNDTVNLDRLRRYILDSSTDPNNSWSATSGSFEACENFRIRFWEMSTRQVESRFWTALDQGMKKSSSSTLQLSQNRIQYPLEAHPLVWQLKELICGTLRRQTSGMRRV